MGEGFDNLWGDLGRLSELELNSKNMRFRQVPSQAYLGESNTKTSMVDPEG
jgi:hypothetical protein